jgi:hypothetical protein
MGEERTPAGAGRSPVAKHADGGDGDDMSGVRRPPGYACRREESFTCVPLKKTVLTSVPLKKFLAPVCHHPKLLCPLCHSVHDPL